MVTVIEHPITSADGAASVVDEYRPEPGEADAPGSGAGAAAGSTILFLPALGVPIGYYRPLFEEWAARGHRIFGLEVRGRPRSSTTDVRHHDFGYATLLELDLPAALAQTPLAQATDLTLVGHSLGGLLSLLGTGAGILHPARIVTVGSGVGHYSSRDGWWPRFTRRLVTPFAVAISYAVGYFPGDRLGFGDRQPKTMIRDWHREAWHNRFMFENTAVDYEAGLARLDVPVLQLSLEGDAIVSARAVDLLAERVGTAAGADRPAGDDGDGEAASGAASEASGSGARTTVAASRVERIHVPAALNGGVPWDHVRWVRQARGAVLDLVDAWIAAH